MRTTILFRGTVTVQTVLIIVWVAINARGITHKWDPFILLNLGFSSQAFCEAPLILIASNRSAKRDRMTLEHDSEEVDAKL